MSNFYLAELDTTKIKGVIQKHKTEASARIWGFNALNFNPEFTGPCNIFLVHERTGETELIRIIRRAGDNIEDVYPKT